MKSKIDWHYSNLGNDIDLTKKLNLTITPKLRVVVLTGAGISAESGVPVFRGKGSLWEIPEARRLANRAGPPWNTKETWEYYDWRRELVRRCMPNAAHNTLVEMEGYFNDFCLITQNVDGLHRKAGSKNVLELHGNMWKGRCVNCNKLVDLPEISKENFPPHCICGYILRPNVVQFGESLDHEVLRSAFTASKDAELFLVIGTSGVVSPASEMPLLALENGAKVVEFNPTSTILTPYMSLTIKGKAAGVLPPFWKEILANNP